MTVYRVETQEDYDELMIELEEQGYKWRGGEKLTDFDEFSTHGKDTYVYEECCEISISSGDYFKKHYSDVPVIEYKAKGENMKLYHTETQVDYDALMIELEEKGYKWYSGYKPTSQNYWSEDKEKSCIKTSDKYITFGSIEWHKKNYPDIPIIEYKADKQGETDAFIKELTVKIYYNEVTKKHYNSYEDAIADCKKEMERQHDKN